MTVQVGNGILDNVLLDGRLGVNLIIEEKRVRLEMKNPQPAPFRLMIAEKIVVGQWR